MTIDSVELRFLIYLISIAENRLAKIGKERSDFKKKAIRANRLKLRFQSELRRVRT